MPSFFNSTPQGNRVLPNFHESSPMRSPRDSDATGRQYLRSAGIKAQLLSIVNSIGYLRRELGKLRRIIHGGGTAGSATGVYIAGQWSPTAVYPDTTRGAQAIVIYNPAGAAAGTFYTLQSVPAGVTPDTGAPYWASLPQPPAGVFL